MSAAPTCLTFTLNCMYCVAACLINQIYPALTELKAVKSMHRQVSVLVSMLMSVKVLISSLPIDGGS